MLATFPDDVIAGASSRSATKYQEVRAEAQQDQAHGTYLQQTYTLTDKTKNLHLLFWAIT